MIFVVDQPFSCNILLSNMFTLVYNLTMSRLPNGQSFQIIEFCFMAMDIADQTHFDKILME